LGNVFDVNFERAETGVARLVGNESAGRIEAVRGHVLVKGWQGTAGEVVLPGGIDQREGKDGEDGEEIGGGKHCAGKTLDVREKDWLGCSFLELFLSDFQEDANVQCTGQKQQPTILLVAEAPDIWTGTRKG
jgi:hypothetical protein